MISLGRSPEEWEEYCLQLLRLKHGSALQVVPAHDRGDLGIEAFTNDGSGIAFQCYSAEEPISTGERYDKQRDKMTRDLNKLKVNDLELTRLVGTAGLREWRFLVPLFDSRRLLSHAATKTAEMRQCGATCVAPTFAISVATDADYPIERQALISAGVRELRFAPALEDTEAESWIASRGELIDRVRDKASHLKLTAEHFEEFIREIVLKHLHTANMLDELSRDYPILWVKLQRLKTDWESTLRLRSITSPTEGVTLLSTVVVEFGDQIRTSAPAVAGHAELISWGTVGDWLMRCPLDFPEASDA